MTEELLDERQPHDVEKVLSVFKNKSHQHHRGDDNSALEERRHLRQTCQEADGERSQDRSDFSQGISLDDFLFGFGAGIRFTIPQFPIRMYLGKRFSFDYNDTLSRYTANWQDGPLFGGWGVDFVISLGGDTF